jgi:hypothetical protein
MELVCQALAKGVSLSRGLDVQGVHEEATGVTIVTLGPW